MPFDLPQEIGDVPGRPAKVRIGTVTSVDSVVTVTVQGTEFVGVGVLDSYTPVLDDTVALLGQSAVSTDQSSWLLLGKVNAADVAVSRTALRLLSMTQAAGVANTNVTSVSTQVNGLSMNVTVEQACSYELQYTIDAISASATNTTAVFQANLDGFPINGQCVFGNGGVNTLRAMIGQIHTGTLTAGTYTFDVFCQRVGGIDNAIVAGAPHSHMVLKIFGP